MSAFTHPKCFIRTFFLALTTASQVSAGPKDMLLFWGNSLIQPLTIWRGLSRVSGKLYQIFRLSFL